MTLKIVSARRFEGPSTHAPEPSLVLTLSEGGEGAQPNALARARACVERCVPDAAWPEPATAGVAGLIADACRVVQHACGVDAPGSASPAVSPSSARRVVVPSGDPELCAQVARRVVAVLRAAIDADADAEAVATSKLDDVIAGARKRQMPLQDRALLAAAEARGIPVHRLAHRVVVLGHGVHQQRISGTKTSLTGVFGNDLAANKDYSRRMLQGVGLPVPAFERVYGVRQAVDAAERIGYPVVVKPNNSGMGVGVSVGMKDAEQVRAAFRLAREADRSVLVEELVQGDDHRILVVDGRFVAATRRIPAHVVGDGRSTVRELVDRLNGSPRRAGGHRSPLKPIGIDATAERLLAEQGCSPDAVPGLGDRVFLRRNANLSTGGTPYDVTDEVHPDNRDIAERAARAIGLDVAGIDVLTTDIGVSMWENGGRICEVNSRPGIHMHLWPEEGLARDVIAPILDMLFPPGRPSRIPLVGVLGGARAEHAARVLADALAAAGLRVGHADRHGVRSAGRRVGLAPMAPPEATRALLLDPALEVAVIALSPADVLDVGVARDPFDLLLLPDDPGSDTGADAGRAGGFSAAGAVVAGATRGEILVEGRVPEFCADAGARIVRIDGRSLGGESTDALDFLRSACTGQGPDAGVEAIAPMVLAAVARLGVDIPLAAGDSSTKSAASASADRSGGRVVVA